ncbi:adhesive plaque matrix protein [Hyalella azteca]|uniref:Adhesive plaque matrix protein n=1 Tax=Hyalella azteca TaxID=294128 RepID=A0A8B7N4Y8_HYAAZ|nr:adhesive plaque matrix protein [Hyalella azteca]
MRTRLRRAASVLSLVLWALTEQVLGEAGANPDANPAAKPLPDAKAEATPDAQAKAKSLSHHGLGDYDFGYGGFSFGGFSHSEADYGYIPHHDSHGFKSQEGYDDGSLEGYFLSGSLGINNYGPVYDQDFGHAHGYGHGYKYLGFAPNDYQGSGCYKAHYITKYNTVYKDVPIYKQVYRTQVIPETYYHTIYLKDYVTKYNTKQLPHYITEYTTVKDLKYVTKTETAYETKLLPQHITKVDYVPTYQTEKKFIPVYKTKQIYETVIETKYEPSYVTEIYTQSDYEYTTDYFPTYKTITKVTTDYKTLCSKPLYGHTS